MATRGVEEVAAPERSGAPEGPEAPERSGAPEGPEAPERSGAPVRPEAPGDALERVLQAEQAALEAEDRAEEEAARELAQAREAARHIGARADARLGRIRHAEQLRLEARLEALREEASAGIVGLQRLQEQGDPITGAIERVIDWLLGLEREGPGSGEGPEAGGEPGAGGEP
ncbi:MAG: hypothetical protein OEY14_16730, partial [Myxococcales bacterium]|nr:hypothetical protein [Myxococcales bacterium]